MPFEARDYPTVIWLGDEAVSGPFCTHCGYPLALHEDATLRCPLRPNPVLGPNCECHEITGDPCPRCAHSPRYVQRQCPTCHGNGKINLRIARKVGV